MNLKLPVAALLQRGLMKSVHPIFALALALALQPGPLVASETPAKTPWAGFTHVRSLGGTEEFTLNSNGLDVLVMPDHSAPVVTFNVTYHVGSRNEVTGTTGATHILEHLMFKGSGGFNDAKGNSIKQYLERVGGWYNARTSFDCTSYFATVGIESLEGYIAIEADRMRNLSLRESDHQSEMTVVRNEFERVKNEPNNILSEEVAAAAYQALPYHHDPIGWRSDIEHVPIQKLKAFYDTFYWPNNATVTVAGDIEPAAALALIRKYYGTYPRSPAAIPALYTEEPEQTGARRVIVKRPGEQGLILIAHKVSNARAADHAAIAVLDGILGTGKNSRLYRRLVDQGLAVDVDAYTDSRYDLSLHQLYASVAPGITHAAVEAAILEEIARLQTGGVTEAEVERVQQQTLAQQSFKRDGTYGIAAELSFWIAVGDWTLYQRFPEQIAKVTPADVQRVAQMYLNEDQSTTGWFVPVGATK